MRISQDQLDGDEEVTGGVDVTAGYTPLGGGVGEGNVTVEAVMTGVDNTTTVMAQSLSLVAQTSTLLFNTPTWGTVLNGTSECEDCASVRLDSLDRATQRVKVHVVLKSAVEVGLLYLATVGGGSS